jgi:hypothetical protein
MLRAMHRRTDDMDALEPLRQRFKTQHYSLRKFYYECSNLKYLTGLINVPKLGQVCEHLNSKVVTHISLGTPRSHEQW